MRSPIVVRNDARHLGRARGRRLRQHRHLARDPGAPTTRATSASAPTPSARPRCRCWASASATRASGTWPEPTWCTPPRSMHGRLSAVYHDDSPLFAGIPQGFQVVRYHSLCITEPLPDGPRGHRLDGRRRGDGRRAPHRARCGASSSTRSRSPPSGAAACSPTSATSPPGCTRRRAAAGARSPARRRTPAQGLVAAAAPEAAAPGQAARPPLRLRAGVREPLRGPPLRLLARQQQGGRALALLVHGRQRRPAQLGDHLRRGRGEVHVGRGVANEVHRESIFDYLSRGDEAPALPLRRPALRLQLRLRGLLRLRAEGRLRGRRAATTRRCPTPRSSSPTG